MEAGTLFKMGSVVSCRRLRLRGGGPARPRGKIVLEHKGTAVENAIRIAPALERPWLAGERLARN